MNSSRRADLQTMKLKLALPAVLVLAFASSAGSAFAWKADVSGDTLSIAGGSQKDFVMVFDRAGKERGRRVLGLDGQPKPGLGCDRVLERFSDMRRRVVRCPGKGSGLSADAIKRVTIDGGPANDALFGIYITGEDTYPCRSCRLTQLPFSISGGAGDDTLFGGPKADRLFGGEGDDGVVAVGIDYADGGAGSDRVGYPSVTPVTADLAAGTVIGPDGVAVPMLNFESLAGGDGNDTLLGTDGANEMVGGGGSDVINPRGGPDDVRTSEGPNKVLAIDGAADRIECGDSDRVFADPVDKTEGCSLVERIAPQSVAAGVDHVSCPDATMSVRRRTVRKVVVEVSFSAMPAFSCAGALRLASLDRVRARRAVAAVPGSSIELEFRFSRSVTRLLHYDGCAQLTMLDAAGNSKEASGGALFGICR